MAGIPADDRFRPPDPSTVVWNPIVQSSIHEVTESSSTFSQLREEKIHTATVEADMDESRYNYDICQKTSGLEGEIPMVDEQAGLKRRTSQERETAQSSQSRSTNRRKLEKELVMVNRFMYSMRIINKLGRRGEFKLLNRERKESLSNLRLGFKIKKFHLVNSSKNRRG
ncbi:uncharacterized protein LOC107002355 [Solanum pennellii]|uniref:Uncharacterized protein LOC107002355 n=1 Tax=Solanum pennellii TaxID=28526 RepID=A0ABM1FEN2_SOLPN|nr:uncharacterized protein LOC107002355 [Solanum pennellii]XP_015055822.1 uncharacterized protein LOC107002355 [Solanum pennellii]